jgi:hypothetical protein
MESGNRFLVTEHCKTHILPNYDLIAERLYSWWKIISEAHEINIHAKYNINYSLSIQVYKSKSLPLLCLPWAYHSLHTQYCPTNIQQALNGFNDMI